MALVFTQKCKAPFGGRAFRAYEITSDGATTTINASDLDLNYIENVWLASKNDLSATAELDPADLADGESDTTQVSVTGAVLGDFVQVVGSVDCDDCTITASVQSAGKVDILFSHEESGGNINLGATPFHVRVLKRVGLTTQTGKYITFWPTLTDGDKFTLWCIGY